MELNFSNNLKRLRLENSLSQKQLAEKLNTTTKTISHWETAYTEPSISQILEISKLFQVSLEDLLL